MAEITHFDLTDATNRTSSAGSATEVTARTVDWTTDLVNAGFTAGDVVFIIWSFSLGGDSITGNDRAGIGHGTTFAGRTEFNSSFLLVEPDGNDLLEGAKHFIWVEEHTLVTNENFYFNLYKTGAGTDSTSANFSVTFLKRGDLSADDYRYSSASPARSNSTTWTTDTSVTLPSGGGDDWLIIGASETWPSSTTRRAQMRIDVDGSTQHMDTQIEGEDTNETHARGIFYYHASAGASDVISLQNASNTASSADIEEVRLLALRLDAFADHVGLYDATTDALSTTADTFVETGTISLSLSATGNVFVAGQSIITSGDTDCDPYLRLQEGGSDIVTDLGRAGGHFRDTAERVDISAHTVANMTSGTKTIDMDVAQDTNTTSADAVERTLVAFSMELAGAGQNVAPSSGSLALAGVQPTATIQVRTTPAIGTVAIAGQSTTATVSAADQDVAPATGALAIAGIQPTATLQMRAVPVSGVLALTGIQPAATLQVRTAPTSGALSISGIQPSVAVTTSIDIAPTAGVLALAGVQPTATLQVRIATTAGAVSLAGVQPTATLQIRVAPVAGQVALAGIQPSVIVTAGNDIAPSAGALSIAGIQPTATLQIRIAAAAGALSLSGVQPRATLQVRAIPTEGQVALTGIQPSVGITTGDNIAPSRGVVALAGVQPTATIQVRVAPGTASLAVSGASSSVLVEAIKNPTVGQVALAGIQPSVAITSGHDVAPSAGLLALAGIQPTATLQVRVAPALGALALNGIQPSVLIHVFQEPTHLTADIHLGAVLTGRFRIAPALTARVLSGSSLVGKIRLN